jgi:hypothetical protein
MKESVVIEDRRIVGNVNRRQPFNGVGGALTQPLVAGFDARLFAFNAVARRHENDVIAGRVIVGR